MNDRTGERGGFTLIEIIIVLLIIGLVLLYTLGGRKRQPRTATLQTAQTLLSLVETCRAGASLRNQARTLVYDLDAAPQQVWIEIPPPPEDPSREPERIFQTPLPARLHLAGILLDENTTQKTGQVRLTAQPNGFLPAHLAHLTHDDMETDWTVLVRSFPGQGRILEAVPDWKGMMRTQVEDDFDGVKPLEPEEE